MMLFFISAPMLWAADIDDYMPLIGSWQGMVVTNLKDASGGGNPTQGEIGTSVTIDLERKNKKLSGSSTIGSNPTEVWTIENDTYTWNDGEITVTAQRIAFDAIPSWAVKQAKIKSGDAVFAFKYQTCKVNKDGSACKIGKHIPSGIEQSGLWVFSLKQGKLYSDVFYTYATGGKRILQQRLTQKSKPGVAAENKSKLN